MLNVLVIEDNPYLLKSIVNYISIQIPDVKLYSISFDGESILELLKESYVDIIILDLKLSGISGIDIINYINNNKLYKYKKSIIVFSGEVDMINTIIHSPYLYSYILKSEGYEKLIYNIKLLVKEKKNNYNTDKLIYKIDNELKALNYNFSYNGTKYLRETIIEIYKRKDNFDGNLSKNIYPIIAKKYHKKTNTIHCNIKQATNAMILDCDEDTLNKFLHNNFFIKPKVNEIIMIILNNIIKN